MKHFPQTTRQTQQIFAAVVLTSILSIGAGTTLTKAAAANSVSSSQGVTSSDQSRISQAQWRNADRQLPLSIIVAVRRDIVRSTGTPPSQLRVVTFTSESWRDSCLGLGKPNESCAQVFIENGWRVVMTDNRQTWTYRTDNTGRTVRLETHSSNSSNLPNSVADAVLQVATKQMGLPSSQLKITKAEKQTWTDGCLGLPSPVERCMSVLTPGWRVVVEGKQKTQVYRTDNSGSRVRAETIAAEPSDDKNLPDSVSKAVLQNASKQLNLSTSQLRIVQTERRDWPNGCLGLVEPGVFCTQMVTPGWQVTVEGGKQRLVYRTNSSGSLIKLEGTPTQGNTKAVPIPKNELPSSLQEGAIFRAISSGGFTGQTSEIILLNNGQMVRRVISPTSTSSTATITKVSGEKFQQFKQLLSQQSLTSFNGLSYPAPQGAADYITVTMSSQTATIRYVDMDQEHLPKPLQEVIQAWNEIARSR